MKKSGSKVAIVLAVLVGFFLMFAGLFVSVEAEHECIGEDCTICQVIDACEKIQDNLLAVVSTTTVIVALCFAVVAVLKLNSRVCGVISLVTLKTKISD